MTGVVTVLKGSRWTSGTLLHLSAGARSLITRVTCANPNLFLEFVYATVAAQVLIITAVHGSHTQDSSKPASLDTGSSCGAQLALTSKMYFAVYSEP